MLRRTADQFHADVEKFLAYTGSRKQLTVGGYKRQQH